MKNMLCEKVAQLGAAQECMVEVADQIEQWEHSQLILEKSAFTTINTSDKILNLSMKGTTLVDNLHNEMKASKGPNADAERLEPMLQEIQQLFDHILSQAKESNDIAHQLEQEVDLQREIGEGMKCRWSTVSDSVEAAVACAEFILAEL